MTVRGVFYQMVNRGAVPKHEGKYKEVGRDLLALRRSGEIPYDWIADHTRWMRKPTTHDSPEAALQETVRSYRRALWRDQDAYVEIWMEKDTLAGVVVEVTDEFDVPLMVVRGFSSETFLHSAAEHIRSQTKPAYLYVLSDHDPSGHATMRHVERRLRAFLGNHPHPVSVERIAVTEEQIAAWNLPTRPTKSTDSRSKTFVGESVELDAIPAPTLRALVRSHIERHIDEAVLDRTRMIEEAEREVMGALISRYRIVRREEEAKWHPA
jgi:hypothetical protein